jgi:putative membrane protein insertion efficiency factor
MVGMLVFTGMPAFGSPYTMKGPPRHTLAIHPDEQLQSVSDSKNILLKAIHFYRSVISPTQVGRCGFYPSCSTFGMHAVQRYGALQGVGMTADRLTRCNVFKQPGTDYYRRPDGRLTTPSKQTSSRRDEQTFLNSPSLVLRSPDKPRSCR